ncbi:MAG: hypothetical protein O7G85_05750 [Planctomycetota bacterium]|nr:hypothetical protein [Planctomycetota bacterium]
MARFRQRIHPGFLATFLMIGVTIVWPTLGLARQGQKQLVPESFILNDVASKAIGAEWLTEAERRELRVFHGVWDRRDLIHPTDQAFIALNAWNFDDPSLSNPKVPVEIRAEALLNKGEVRDALALLEDTLSIRASRIRAEAYEMLGEMDKAEDAVGPAIALLLAKQIEDPDELTEAVKAMVIRARIQGQPSRDFQTMMSLLAKAGHQIDRLYWPARLEEAKLLLDKHNTRVAVQVLAPSLQLNV